LTGRPYDWAPLAESDPLPGDPDAIHDHAMRLRNAAAEMTSQVNLLRRMAATEASLAGAYATALTAKATDVAKKLDPIITRYATVSACLLGWAPELADFQGATLRVLAQAQDAAARRARDPNASPLPPLFEHLVFNPLGAGERTQLDQATAQLVAARHDLERILAEAAERDRHWGHRIADAVDDKLTDGFFDHLHSLVEHHAGMLEKFTEWAGYLTSATALVAIALPGLNLALLGAAGAITATHLLLAAEGEGSWWEVGLDTLALASFGGGKILSKGLEHLAEHTRDAAAQAASREAAEQFRHTTEESIQKVLTDPASTTAERNAARRSYFHMDDGAAAVGQDAAQRVLEAPESTASVKQAYLAGAKDDARTINTITRLLGEHPGDQAVETAARNLRKLRWAGRTNVASATAIDLADKAAGQWSDSYGSFKERFKVAEGTLK
jgi:hypothetical protein